MEDKMKVQLDKTIEVYYTKKPEINREREEDKEKTIKWIIDGIMKGPIKGGVQGQENQCPDYVYTFSSTYIWEGEKKCILIRDPICRICGKNPSVEVHHIRPKHLKGHPIHPGNLIGLCLDCHDEVHRRIDKGISNIIEESLDVDFTISRCGPLDKFNE